MELLSEEDKFAIEVVGSVLPFKVNNYVIDELINWDDVPNDPMFILTFPTKDILIEEHFNIMADLIRGGASKQEIKAKANEIWLKLILHQAGQLDHIMSMFNDEHILRLQYNI